jgi:hypothetical protein
MNPKIHATMSQIRRPWSDTNEDGFLYEISIFSFRDIGYELDFEAMLRATEEVHDKCVHISIKGNGSFSALFPAHLGEGTNFTTIATILSAGVNCSLRPRILDNEIQRLSRRTPEYVLWPDNPLFWYDALMTDSLIILD